MNVVRRDMKNVVSIAENFSKHPAGRTNADGPYNGQKFRRKFLVDPLKNGRQVTVVLDGASGYGSSFLEEAFGGLVRAEGIPLENVRRLLHVVAHGAEYQPYISLIDQYVKSAEACRPIGAS